LTAATVNVTAAVQGDLALKFEYASGCGFTWDLGYNFWGRSCEKICVKKGCTTTTALDGKTWALKGDAQVYGFLAVSADGTQALGASESLATINNGTNVFGPGNDSTAVNTVAILNPNIDNPQFAFSSTLGLDIDSGSGGTGDQTSTSIQALPLSISNVNYQGTKGISNKVFTHFGYAWTDCEDWTPFLGVGASAEFGSGKCNTNCNTGCNTGCSTSNVATTASTNCATNCGSSSNSNCKSCAISQWAVWVKGGVAFN
jgi:hypothetical protein